MKTNFTYLSYSFFRGLLFLSLIVFHGLRLSAQYDLLYENHEQNSLNVPRDVADDGQGNTWLSGYFTGSLTLGTITLTNTSSPSGASQTGFIGKFNSNSNTWLWAKKIERASASSSQVNVSAIEEMAIDNAGNVFITGYYQGVVRFDHISLTSTKQGQQYTVDIFVAKYNASGGIVWAKSLGSKAGRDRGNTIALDGAGNIFIGGSFTNVHKHYNVCGGDGGVDIYDIYLAKLNSAGTTLWQKRYANALLSCDTYNAGNDLSVDASGNVCMVGQFTGTVSFGSGAALTISSVNGSIDVFAAKINASGVTQWVKATGGIDRDLGDAIHTDASGNVYAGGGVPPNAFLTKYNSTGNLEWSVNPYPPSLVFPSNAISRINPHLGSILVNDGPVGFKTISPADGSVMSSDSLVGNTSLSSYFNIRDTEIAGSGFVFIMSGRCGEVTIGGTALTSATSCPINSNNFFLVRNGSDVPPPAFQQPGDLIDPLTSFHVFDKDELEVYPNPARDQLHITLPEREKEATLFIQNQYGRTVWSEKMDSQRSTATISLDGQSFQSGIYFIHVRQRDQHYTRQLIIAK